MAKLSWMTGRPPEPEFLPTPSFGLNRALGGQGLSSGRVHLYWGTKGSGKSSMTLQQVALAQSQGKICAYIDSEKSLGAEWAEKCGVNWDELLYVQANGAEDILALTIPDLASGKIDVLVIDSLSSINFNDFFEPDKNPIGSYARSSKMILHKLLHVLNHDQQIILISHAAMDLSGYHPTLRANTGSATNHWASTIIKVQKMGSKDSVREDGAHLVKWKVEKSKQSPYPVDGEFFFDSSTARIDTIAEIASIAVLEGVVDKAGAWLYYHKGQDDELRWLGSSRFSDYLKEHPDFLEQVKEELNSIQPTVLEE